VTVASHAAEPDADAEPVDVLVVGSGNAGFSAALTAHEAGASVAMIDRASAAWAGGNSAFTAGAYRTSYDGLDDLRPYIGLSDDEAARTDLPPYPAPAFLADVQRVTQGRADPALARIVTDESADGFAWLAGHGVAWELMAARQSFEVNGRRRYWGNLVVGVRGGGRGLVAAELAALERAGVPIAFETDFDELAFGDGRIAGARVVSGGMRRLIAARTVVLASGGFEADAARRAAFLGAGWDLAKVRGTPHNTGGPLFAAIAAGAAPRGHWSGCHAISWDAAAPPTGDPVLTNRFSRQGYPYGLMVNRDGRRFVDEGADFRNYTYARYGAEVLRQPGSIAYQLFDADSIRYVNPVDYDTAGPSRAEAGTVAALAAAIDVDRPVFEATIEAYNGSIGPQSFDPTIKDGKRTHGLVPDKTNWALPLARPPFTSFAVTCGITFTFGGLHIDLNGSVLAPGGQPIGGLFAAGEIVGGIFYHNYPGGSGLTAGTVLGRRAGREAAAVARAQRVVRRS
jgi:tricarballylate dehydrogenase